MDRLSWRRVAALIAGLSAKSRYAGALRNDHDRPPEVSGAAADSYLASLVTKE